jgi:hypothetical protein
MSVELVGHYFGDSYGGTPPYTAACGWSGLTIGNIIRNRAAPYRIDHNGTPIGWAPASSLRFRSLVQLEWL